MARRKSTRQADIPDSKRGDDPACYLWDKCDPWCDEIIKGKSDWMEEAPNGANYQSVVIFVQPKDSIYNTRIGYM